LKETDLEAELVQSGLHRLSGRTDMYQDGNRRLETEMADTRLHFVACYREREPEYGCHYLNLITLLQTLVFI
jgi:hypothetical protein